MVAAAAGVFVAEAVERLPQPPTPPLFGRYRSCEMTHGLRSMLYWLSMVYWHRSGCLPQLLLSLPLLVAISAPYYWGCCFCCRGVAIADVVAVCFAAAVFI